MTTKAQKRLAAQKKREAFLEEIRQSGLEAQRIDHEIRRKEELRAWQNIHDKKHHTFIKECPHCQDIQKQQRQSTRDR